MSDPTLLEANKTVIRRYYTELWNQRNLALISELFAPDNVYRGWGSNHDFTGLEGANQYVRLYQDAFPDLCFTIEELVAEGDRVAACWTARGTHHGELRGIAPTGNPITIHGISIARLAAGKIAEYWTSWDMFLLLSELGYFEIQ